MPKFSIPIAVSTTKSEQWVYGSNESGKKKVIATSIKEALWVVTHCRNDDGSRELTFSNDRKDKKSALEKQSVVLMGKKISVSGGKQHGTNHGSIVRIDIG